MSDLLFGTQVWMGKQGARRQIVWSSWQLWPAGHFKSQVGKNLSQVNRLPHRKQRWPWLHFNWQPTEILKIKF